MAATTDRRCERSDDERTTTRDDDLSAKSQRRTLTMAKRLSLHSNRAHERRTRKRERNRRMSH
ncbi:hypothetical protein C8039_15630 [Halogeometricum sp. wsp3]|nr:hypothetical protein C8039_15630 [Halogeometricum sp. wsp3]